MRRILLLPALFMACVMFYGCVEGTSHSGSTYHITLYSGGKVVAEWRDVAYYNYQSSGRIIFNDKTGRRVHLRGSWVIEQGPPAEKE